MKKKKCMITLVIFSMWVVMTIISGNCVGAIRNESEESCGEIETTSNYTETVSQEETESKNESTSGETTSDLSEEITSYLTEKITSNVTENISVDETGLITETQCTIVQPLKPDKEATTAKIKQRNIKIVVYNNGKKYEIIEKNKKELVLPKNYEKMIKSYPFLKNDGYVFCGWYKGKNKVTVIRENTELTLKWRKIKVRLINVKNAKGKVRLYFNNKDWNKIDGIEVMYSSNLKFANSRIIKLSTWKKKVKSYEFKHSGKKFKNGKAYFFKVKFFYYINSRKKYYKGTGPYKWVRYYKRT